MPSKCALCGKQSALRESHIIPKFVLKWIKSTSATGYLVSAANAEKRLQDGTKIRLLCDGCEELFSRSEKYFSEKIFRPYHDKGVRSFEYDEALERYLTSLSWRALKMTYDNAVQDKPHFAAAVDNAEVSWREFLLGRRQSIEPYANHLVFINDKSNCGGFHSNEWYTSRGVDSTLAMSKKVAFAYSLLPQMAVVTSIYPATMEGWSGTSISRHGKIETDQSAPHPMFWKFVASRASHAMSLPPPLSISEGRRRIKRALEADPEKVLKSESMKLVMKDEDGERGDKMRSKKMPDMIIRLVEYVIGRSEGAHGTDTIKNESARWATRRIADVLASLPRKDAEKVSYEIENTIDKAKRTGEYRGSTKVHKK